MNDYQVVEVVKGSLINECARCGAIVLHRPAHDAWHATLADWLADGITAGIAAAIERLEADTP